MQINKKITSYNHYAGRAGQSIKYIVIHYVGALGGAQENCNYYASGDVGASAHYYVGFNGEIWQSVEDANGAWSVGGGVQGSGHTLYGVATNYNTLNIEMCIRKGSTATMNATDRDWYFEDVTVKSTIELTKMLMQKYNIPADRVIRHYDVNGKICPNPYVYNHTKHTWTAFKAALSGVTPAPTPTPETGTMYRVQTGAFKNKANATTLASTLKKLGYDTILAQTDGYYKVQVGAYTVQDNATNIQNNLKRDGFEAFIVRASQAYQKWGAKCTGDSVNVRTGAGTGYANVADYPHLNAGNEIDVIGEQVDSGGRKWYKVLIRNAITGFVAADYIKKA